MRWNLGIKGVGNRSSSSSDGSKTHQIYMNFDEVSHLHTKYHNIMFNNMHFIYLHSIQSEPMVFLSSPFHSYSSLPLLLLSVWRTVTLYIPSIVIFLKQQPPSPPKQQQCVRCAYILPAHQIFHIEMSIFNAIGAFILIF